MVYIVTIKVGPNPTEVIEVPEMVSLRLYTLDHLKNQMVETIQQHAQRNTGMY